MTNYMFTYKILNPKLRAKILTRDNNTCAFKKLCPEVVNRLEIHHIDGNRENNEDSNLLTVCVRCHNFLDRELRKSRETERGRVDTPPIVISCLNCSKEYKFVSHRGVKFCSRSCLHDYRRNPPQEVVELIEKRRFAAKKRVSESRKKMRREDPEFRRKLIMISIESYKRLKDRKETDPCFKETFLKKNREAVRRHREKIRKISPCNNPVKSTATYTQVYKFCITDMV